MFIIVSMYIIFIIASMSQFISNWTCFREWHYLRHTTTCIIGVNNIFLITACLEHNDLCYDDYNDWLRNVQMLGCRKLSRSCNTSHVNISSIMWYKSREYIFHHMINIRYSFMPNMFSHHYDSIVAPEQFFLAELHRW